MINKNNIYVHITKIKTVDKDSWLSSFYAGKLPIFT